MTMTIWALAMALNAAPPAGDDCADYAKPSDYHLADVCSEWIEGALAYSATMRASLSPRPAAQQVLIFQVKDGWRMRVAGYRLDLETGATTTRVREMLITYKAAEPVILLLGPSVLMRLDQLPYYGDENRICVDGANYELALGDDGQRFAASQHSCADPSELDTIAAAFRSIALQHDPEFDGLLYGLNRSAQSKD